MKFYKDRVRHIEPSYYIFEFEYKNRLKKVTLRKGFGQFAILELEDNSLDYFVHRGDGMGEGGNAVFYLGNQKLRYKPISKLFDTLIKKIKNQGFTLESL